MISAGSLVGSGFAVETLRLIQSTRTDSAPAIEGCETYFLGAVEYPALCLTIPRVAGNFSRSFGYAKNDHPLNEEGLLLARR